ncbi:MAG TPA: IPT/TIG domain-containing protein [Acidobacteriaceae bacterium]|nr:IPT/TIG domain-containing protein [Acidobacteriaceae bacterium]
MSAIRCLLQQPEGTLHRYASQEESIKSAAAFAAARVRARAGGALFLLAVVVVLSGCFSGGGGKHNGTGVNNQIIDLNGDVTVDNQPAGPNLNFTAGTNATLHFTVGNVGDKPSDQTITVTAALPSGLSYASYTSITSGTWSCSASGQNVTCTSSASIAGLANAIPAFDVTVKVAGTASGNAQLPVTISTPDGTPSSNSGAKGVIFTAAKPNISSLSPTSGTGGTAVTITGSSFGSSQGSSTVTFNGTKATATSWSDTSIVANVPAGTPEGAGPVIVTVNGVASNSVAFTVTGPQITSLSPTSGAIGTAVTIAGSHFGASQGTSTVSFNGTNATAITTWSDTSIVANVPSLATTGNVVVTVAGISSPITSSTVFTVTGAGGCASGGNAASLLTGDYAFGGQGFAGGTTFSAVIGRFHADGLNTISNGLIQKNSIGSGAASGNPSAFTGCFTLTTPAAASGVALGTLTFNTSPVMTMSIAIRSNGNGNFITYDASSPQLAGVLEKQCPNAANGTCGAFANSNISGGYGFGFDGIVPGNATANFGVAGQITAGNGGANGMVDIASYAGVIAVNDPIAVSGGVTDTANGQAQLDLNVTYNNGGQNQAVTLIMDCYLANLSSSGVAGAMYCMSAYAASQGPPSMPLLSGRFVTQNTPAGGWTNGNLAPASNASVSWSTGITGTGNPRIDVGQLAYNTSANPATITISQDQNHGGSYSFQQIPESVSVATNGRVQATVNGTLVGVCYMLSPGQGICINEANNAALIWLVPQEAQPAGGFTIAGLSNSFALGTLDPATGGVSDIDGVLTATGATGALSGQENINTTAGLSAPSFAATYSIMSAADAAIGRYTVMETSPATDTLILYLIDANTAVAVSTTSTQPAVLYLRH